ncbi:MAG: Panacea domain-containing protein [Methylocella sp.]
MAARLDTVAKFVCEQSGWQISNLSLQKMLYLAQVEYIGEHDGERIVDTAFEAWNFGPVSPELYHKVKIFGSGPVRNVFFGARRFREDDKRRSKLIDVCRKYLGKRPGELVELTHWDFGAWARKYEPNVRGIQITDDDIAREYCNRQRYAAQWQCIAA